MRPALDHVLRHQGGQSTRLGDLFDRGAVGHEVGAVPRLLTKKKVGATLNAIHSLAAETAVLLPIALVIVLVLAARDNTTFLEPGPTHTALLLAAGS
jgi:hypothetical protein